MKVPEENRKVYLLRIFRWGEGPDKSLVGTIEDIRGERKGVFRTGKELLDWILSQKKKEKGGGTHEKD